VGHEIQDMVESHEYVRLHRLSNVLEVYFEDFESHYDKTVRSIFKHFLGNHYPQIEYLVKLASEHDLGRHPDLNPSHVSNTTEKADALLEVKRQYLAEDPCIKRLVESDKLLGYGSLTETLWPSP